MNKKTIARIKADTRPNYVIAEEYAVSTATVFHIKHGPETKLFYSAKERAKAKGLAFDIAIGDILIPEYCPLLGIKLKIYAGTLKKKTGQPDSPTLDRKDSSKGYIKGNVWVISYRANAIKNDSTLEELERICQNWKSSLGLTVSAEPTLLRLSSACTSSFEDRSRVARIPV